MYRMYKDADVWIGIAVLVVIGGLGMWWLFANDLVTPYPTFTTATVPIATSTVATTTPVMLTPQAVNRASQSIITVAEHIAGASKFASLMATSGVAALLKGPGPYTIFVPTNTAFNQLPHGTLAKLSAAGTKRLVEYHIVVCRAFDPSAEVSGSIQALSGDMLNFSLGADNTPLVGSAVLVSAYKAENGIVYLIDNVLIPPSPTQQL